MPKELTQKQRLAKLEDKFEVYLKQNSKEHGELSSKIDSVKEGLAALSDRMDDILLKLAEAAQPKEGLKAYIGKWMLAHPKYTFWLGIAIIGAVSFGAINASDLWAAAKAFMGMPPIPLE